jgi:hypothetical protein
MTGYVVVVHVDGVRLCICTALSNGPPVDMRATVEWYWQENHEDLDKNLSLFHFIHHKSHVYWPGRVSGPPQATNRVSHGTFTIKIGSVYMASAVGELRIARVSRFTSALVIWDRCLLVWFHAFISLSPLCLGFMSPYTCPNFYFKLSYYFYLTKPELGACIVLVFLT